MNDNKGQFYRYVAGAALVFSLGCFPASEDPDDATDMAGNSDEDVALTDTSAPDMSTSPTDMADEDAPVIVAPDGYTTGRILYRGSEAMLFHETDAIGLALDGFGVTSYSLSGDGQVVWIALYNEFAADGPTYKVFSMNIDGSNVAESTLVRPADAPYFPQGFRVRTTGNGEVAVLTQYTYDSNDRVVAQISRAARGEAFSVITTSNGEVEQLGLADSVHTEVTDDGSSVMFSTGRNLWRANESDGWVPFVVATVEDLTWNGDALPSNGIFRGLDITDNGGEFATRVDLTDSTDAIIVGTGIGATAFEAVGEGSFYLTAEIDGAGEVVTYSEPVPTRSFIGPQGGTHDELTAPVGSIDNIDLADGGEIFHAVSKPSKPIPFFGRIGSDERVASMSQQWSIFGMVPSIAGQLSDDGNVFVTPTWGVMAVHRNRNVHGASIDAVFWRFDDDGNLVVRAQVSAAEEVLSVNVMPLYDRYIRPSFLYGYDEDPTYVNRNGLALEELPDQPGTYEAAISINPDATEPLDERYSFRVMVGQGSDGEVTTTGFVDFDLFE